MLTTPLSCFFFDPQNIVDKDLKTMSSKSLNTQFVPPIECFPDRGYKIVIQGQNQPVAWSFKRIRFIRLCYSFKSSEAALGV